MGRFRPGYEGTGPGHITPDGCAVDLYARLPAGTEPDVIASVVSPPASLLELGCGAGRVTRPLVHMDLGAREATAAVAAPCYKGRV